MRAFEWNALRIGDPVLVHVRQGQAFPLSEGVVDEVDSRRGDNGISVRVDGRVVRPSRLSTHLAPFADDTECWRCGRSA